MTSYVIGRLRVVRADIEASILHTARANLNSSMLPDIYGCPIATMHLDAVATGELKAHVGRYRGDMAALFTPDFIDTLTFKSGSQLPFHSCQDKPADADAASPDLDAHGQLPITNHSTTSDCWAFSEAGRLLRKVLLRKLDISSKLPLSPN